MTRPASERTRALQTTAPPALDPVAEEYVALAFAIARHAPGYVDAYVGPPEVRERALAEPIDEPAALLARAQTLAVLVAEAGADRPLGETDPDYPETRVGYLAAQVQGMIATCRILAGEEMPYAEEVRRCFDIEPEATPESVFEAAIEELDGLLPGSGSVAERMIAWRRGFEVPPETAQRLIDLIVPEIRARTAAIVDLPAGEEVAFAMVRDQPWSAYNWYLGDARSRVEFNVDVPIRANELTGLLCHEAYPGHHAERALKEQRLYRERGYGEHAIFLINTPECAISEGIATLAERAIFPDEEVHRFNAERVYPAAELDGDTGREARIDRARHALRGVDANAALRFHAEGRSEEDVVAYLQRFGLKSEEQARHNLRFLADPLWRAYTFTYHAGRDLLDRWLKGGDRAPRFRTLLTEQVYPSQVETWIAQDAAAGGGH